MPDRTLLYICRGGVVLLPLFWLAIALLPVRESPVVTFPAAPLLVSKIPFLIGMILSGIWGVATAMLIGKRFLIHFTFSLAELLRFIILLNISVALLIVPESLYLRVIGGGLLCVLVVGLLFYILKCAVYGKLKETRQKEESGLAELERILTAAQEAHEKKNQ